VQDLLPSSPLDRPALLHLYLHSAGPSILPVRPDSLLRHVIGPPDAARQAAADGVEEHRRRADALLVVVVVIAGVRGGGVGG